MMEVKFPFEFLVFGTPVSLQAKNPASIPKWQEEIRAAFRDQLPEGHWVSFDTLSVTLFYLPPEPMKGDVDNIVKPILDAMNHHIYSDDRQVERVLVRRFNPNTEFEFNPTSEKLGEALTSERPVLYVRVAKPPLEELLT